MAKKSAAKPVEPEDEVRESPEEMPANVIVTEESVAAQPAMSKADACRAALAAGIETTKEAVEFALKNFGVEIKPSDFTVYKSKSKQAAGSAPAGRGPKPKGAPSARKPIIDGYVAPPERPKSVDGETDLLAAMEAIKPLVASLGAEKAHRIIDLLG